MEIVIHSSYNKKIIKVNNSIISIQSDTDKIVNNLIDDYNPVVIDNTNIFFLGNTVLDEITIYNKYPELSIVNEILE